MRWLCALRGLPTFPRSCKHEQKFQAAEASNDNPVASEYILQMLSKFDYVRIFLTSAYNIKTNAVMAFGVLAACLQKSKCPLVSIRALCRNKGIAKT